MVFALTDGAEGRAERQRGEASQPGSRAAAGKKEMQARKKKQTVFERY